MAINYYKGISSEYALALVKSQDASKAFRLAQEQYRARKISDAEFLNARAIYDASECDFDAAFAKESE